MDYSAGIIIYRENKEHNIEVMLSHAGGPYFVNKKRSWTIQKGLLEENEDEEAAARREFEEETGFKITEKISMLGTFKTSKFKTVTVFFLKKDADASKATSNYFELEYPKNSGCIRWYPENDKAEWFDITTAKEKVYASQIQILEKLEEEIMHL